MNASDLNLLELLEIDTEEGAIRFADRRMLLWDADAFGSLRKELIEGLGEQTAKAILKRFGYANGYRDAKMAENLLQWSNDEQWWRACPTLQRHEGKVHPQVRSIHVNRSTKEFEMQVDWSNSYEAEQHLRAIGKSNSPACWTLAGFASGFASAMIGEECIVVETQCVAMGAPCCKVEGRTRQKWGDQAEELASDYRARYLSSELESRERELKRQQLDLAKREQELEGRAHSTEKFVRSPEMEKVYELCAAVAPSGSIVLITGEGGVGKERIAKEIHHKSTFKDGPFQTIHCSALPEVLLESELFGHVASSLAGGSAEKRGLFETTEGGTLFLDEVGELSNASQIKLLRVLQDQEIWPIGATEPRKINLRILAATHHNLEKLVALGSFRADLFYTLGAVSIEIPPLRSRPEEILPLARDFIAISCERGDLLPKTLSTAAAETLADHPWPGNIRELQNAMERAVILSGAANKIEKEHLSPAIRSVAGNVAKVRFDKVMPLAELERKYTLEVLERYAGNRTKTAKVLGIGSNTLWRKLKSWGVPPARGEF